MKNDPLDAYAAYEPKRSVFLTSRGWINLSILVAAIAFSFCWVGWKYMKRQAHRHLESASIAWVEQKPELAWERIESVDTNWIDPSSYHSLYAKMLVVSDPLKALEHLEQWEKAANLNEIARQQILRLKLHAHIQASDWKGLAALVESIRAKSLLPEVDSDLLISEAWLAFEQQDLETVRSKTIAALHSNPHNQEALIFRSSLQSVGTQVIERNQARASLMPIAESESPNAIRALVILLASQLSVDDNDWQRTIELLKANPYFESHYALQKRESLNALVARLRERDPELAYRLASRAVEKPGAGKKEKLQAVYLAQQIGQISDARDFLDSLSPEEADASSKRWLLARQALLENDPTTAVELALEGSDDSPLESRFQQILLEAASSATADEHQPARKRALETLIHQQSLSTQAWLQTAALAWDDLPRLRPPLLEAGLSKAKSQPLPIAQFFSSKGELQTALLVLESAGEQIRNPTGYAIKLNALLGTEQWEKAERLIENADYLQDPYLSLAGKVLLAFKTKSEAEQSKIWDEAIATTEALPQAGAKLANLGDIAFEHQQTAKAGEAYEKAATAAKLADLPLKALMRYAQIEGDAGRTEACLRILEAAQPMAPQNRNLQYEIARLSLLLNRDILRAKDLLAPLDPELPQTKALLALAHLRTAQPKRAYRELEAYATAPMELSNNMRPILYATLVANNEADLAESVLEQIEPEELLPEERDLLQRYAPVVIEKVVVPTPSDSL